MNQFHPILGKYFERRVITMNEQQQAEITKAISLGEEQKYLTYAQINELLPNIIDTEHFNVIISMLESMNIRVCEQPPSEDEFALDGSIEEDSEDLKEVNDILASLNKETGRTSEKVRVCYYMGLGIFEGGFKVIIDDNDHSRKVFLTP